MQAKTRGGARPGSGGTKQNIHLDKDTARTLRAIARQRGRTEEQIVTELINRDWRKLDADIEQASEIAAAGEVQS